MSSVKLLEERIAELEWQLHGAGYRPSIDDKPPETSVIDSLLHANTLVSSALSGREKANSLMKRLPELNSYLDPNFEDSDLQIEAKIELILTMEPEIRENARLLAKLQEMLPILETERIRDVPELTNKLNSVTLSYIKEHDASQELTSEIREVFTRYNAIITSISKSLISLDAIVTAAEIAATPVKQID